MGGSRCSAPRTLFNLFVTFLLSGLWHGAGWTFVLWGVLHGIAQVANRIWSRILNFSMPGWLAWILTFVFVDLAWIVFRAKDFASVRRFCDAFALKHGFSFPETFGSNIKTALFFGEPTAFYAFLAILTVIVFVFPNSDEISQKKLPAWFVIPAASILLGVSLFLVLIPDVKQEFIYFQF